MTPLGAAAVSGGALVVVYLSTLAPGVTLWDSGEFLAAIRTLGIPHPPGTPLYVFAARAWATLLGGVPFAVAVNALSAASAAATGAIMAWLLARWTGRAAAGIAGAIVGGTMAAVWQGATETEIYAPAALAVALALVAAEHAGVRWSHRHRTVIAAVFGLAVPLHISVLVAGPAVILLAATDRSGTVSVRAALAPAASWSLAVGLGTVSAVPVVAGAVLAMAALLAPDGSDRAALRRAALLAPLVTVLGAGFVGVMHVRARHDPAINEGNPSSMEALVDVVARRQYDVPPLWPRRAPPWLQVGNVVQYADWQVASGVSDAPGPSPWRTPVTLVFVALGIVGAGWHRRRDPRGFRALGVLLLCATLGVVAVLNLRAGPSFGWGVLPDDAVREARERDYFFALAFLVAGLWCGCGIAALAERWRGGASRAVWLLAAVPCVLNWRAVDRNRSPDATLASDIAAALLTPLPRDAVLVVAGDNDTFPIWYAQQVEGLRRDVTTVTIPLLGAGWYREELARRHALLPVDLVDSWGGLAPTLSALGAEGTRVGRPVVAAVSVEPADRRAVAPGRGWRLHGMWYSIAPDAAEAPLAIDSGDVAQVVRAGPSGWRGVRPSPPARDPAGRYVQRLLDCPGAALERVSATGFRGDDLLESLCNFR